MPGRSAMIRFLTFHNYYSAAHGFYANTFPGFYNLAQRCDTATQSEPRQAMHGPFSIIQPMADAFHS